jgi:hypothetical protein
LVGLHVLPHRFTYSGYQDFLENGFPSLLDGVPLTVRKCTWFLHVGMPPYFSLVP